MSKLAIFDVDGTLIKGQSQIHFVMFLRGQGILSLLDMISIFAWYFRYLFLSSGIDQSLNEKIYTKILGGKRTEEVAEEINNHFSQEYKNVYPGAKELLKGCVDKEMQVILLSSMPKPLLRAYAEYFGVKDYYGTELEIRDGCYTGKIAGKILVGEEKLKFIKNNYKDSAIEFDYFSDHESDLPVLLAAKEAIVVNPTSALSKIAKQKGWRMIQL